MLLPRPVIAGTALLSLLEGVTAGQRNVTIDDAEKGAPVGHTVPTYSPTNGWSTGSSFTQLDASKIHGGTWHDGTYHPGDAQPKEVNFAFTGTCSMQTPMSGHRTPFVTQASLCTYTASLPTRRPAAFSTHSRITRSSLTESSLASTDMTPKIYQIISTTRRSLLPTLPWRINPTMSPFAWIPLRNLFSCYSTTRFIL